MTTPRLRALLALCLTLGPTLGTGCSSGEPSIDQVKVRVRSASPSVGGVGASKEPAGAPGRLLVVRLGEDGPSVVASRPLPPRVRDRERPGPKGRDGRYEVVDRAGRLLDSGKFRIPRRVHALFDAVEGPAAPGSAPLDHPVVMLRVATPPGAARVKLWDAGRRKALGEVIL